MQNSTELAFSGKYVHHTASGSYFCARCDSVLFSSKAKFDSGSGWPSFYMVRDEVLCKNCGSHLGHLFNDGPLKIHDKKDTGLRYCVNSGALDFKGE